MPITPEMLASFGALVFAHLVADFALQTKGMVENKRRPHIFALHIAIHGLATWAVLGGVWAIALFVMLAHAVIDLVKTFALPDKLWVFLADQAAHLATLAAICLLWPNSFGAGLWAGYIDPSLWVWGAGALTATFAGGPAVGLLMQRFAIDLEDGLPDAGRIIGLLERGLIFVLVMIGEPAAVGFLIAAKSVLRFDTVSKGRGASEYVIVGTLASFGWAMVAALATQGALGLLTP
ncbi:DUF3307 domain-containing protein [Roseobacteraceae bacterium S113]